MSQVMYVSIGGHIVYGGFKDGDYISHEAAYLRYGQKLTVNERNNVYTCRGVWGIDGNDDPIYIGYCEIPKQMLTERMPREMAMKRWPRVVAHIICESLGYFTPEAAANAIIDYKLGLPNCCEWHWDMCNKRMLLRLSPGEKCTKEEFDAELIQVGKDVIERACCDRHYHKGFMSSYPQAVACVKASLAGHGPVFASWF